jgi:hypothetical protein
MCCGIHLTYIDVSRKREATVGHRPALGSNSITFDLESADGGRGFSAIRKNLVIVTIKYLLQKP